VFILSTGDQSSDAERVIGRLNAAAAAAAAEGQPLQLHTLRVLGPGLSPATTGRLLGRLPYLRTLQVSLFEPNGYAIRFRGPYVNPTPGRIAALQQHLVPLSRATQLEELWLQGPRIYTAVTDPIVAGLLPVNLRQLSRGVYGSLTNEVPSLQHLTQLTSLTLAGRLPVYEGRHEVDVLPPRCQEVVLHNVDASSDVLLHHQGVLKGWHLGMCNWAIERQQMFPRLTKLLAADVRAADLLEPDCKAAFTQLTKLTALKVYANKWRDMGPATTENVQAALATAASIRSLRRLELCLDSLPSVAGLSALTGLSHLSINLGYNSGGDGVSLWREEVGELVGLKWLLVPPVLLQEQQTWLGGLKQLQVLVVHRPGFDRDNSQLPWLEGCPWDVLSPRLQVLCFSGMPAQDAAHWQLRRRLRGLLGSSGCEVVVGLESADHLWLDGMPHGVRHMLAYM
jgi:hypothetical protein